MEKNPFSLKRASKASYPSTTYTQKEQADLTQDYMLINHKFIHLLKYGTHVRYINAKGEFRIGGFVARNPLDIGEKRFIKLQNGFNRAASGFVDWVVAYEDIRAIYAKPDAIALTMYTELEQAIKHLNKNILALATQKT